MLCSVSMVPLGSQGTANLTRVPGSPSSYSVGRTFVVGLQPDPTVPAIGLKLPRHNAVSAVIRRLPMAISMMRFGEQSNGVREAVDAEPLRSHSLRIGRVSRKQRETSSVAIILFLLRVYHRTIGRCAQRAPGDDGGGVKGL